MLLKDILGLFFKYPLKGFPVIDDKDESVLGVMTKDKLVELSSSGSNLDLGIKENHAGVIQKLDAETARALFGNLQLHSVIPVLNVRGEIRKVLTFPDLMAGFEKRTEVPAAPEPAAATAGSAAAASAGEASFAGQADPFAVLDTLKVPVMLTNAKFVVKFANTQFLETFNFEKDFILHQRVALFFKGVRLDAGLGGTFSYQHKKWQYRISFGDDLVSVVFLEVKESPAPNPVQKDADRVLKGKATLKAVGEAWENAVIRKVQQKVKNHQAAARKLGMTEEALKYRLQKMK
jgi:hypothetical protein